MSERRVFISVDMEGVAGLTTWRQVLRGSDDFPLARELMTREANAALEGAFGAGAVSVVVSDSHADMTNLLLDRIDRRAEVVQGTPKLPFSMMTGIESGDLCAVFVGYHAGAGTPDGIMDHTYSTSFTDVCVNGTPWNEAVLNAALAGAHGVPVAFVSGDHACCTQVEALVPGARTLAVKEGFGHEVGRSMTPARACDEICAGVQEAVRNADGLEPFRPSPPFALEVEGSSTSVADICSIANGTSRVGPRRVRFETDDVTTMYRCLLNWMFLAGAVTTPG